MVAIHPQSDAPQPKSRWFRLTWPKLLVLTPLLAAIGIGLAVWNRGLPPSWTEDYDQERYTQIRGAIAADPKHLLGKSLDEVIKALSLEDVSWDDSTVKSPGMFRTYHFRGFALRLNLEVLPPGTTPDSDQARNANGEQLRLHGVLWLSYPPPVVRIDGLNDRQERMKRFWRAIDEDYERINAKMERRRQQSRK